MLVSKAKSPKIVCKAGQYDFSIHKKAVYFYVKCLLTFQTMVGLIHEYHGFSVLNVYYFTYFIVLTSIYSGTVLSIARISTGTRSTIEWADHICTQEFKKTWIGCAFIHLKLKMETIISMFKMRTKNACPMVVIYNSICTEHLTCPLTVILCFILHYTKRSWV